MNRLAAILALIILGAVILTTASLGGAWLVVTGFAFAATSVVSARLAVRR